MPVATRLASVLPLGLDSFAFAAAIGAIQPLTRSTLWRITALFGVPSTLFGVVPQDFYGLGGRIALLSALLEDRLHILLGVLNPAPQDHLAGGPGTQLTKQCRRRMQTLPDDQQVRAGDFLNRAEEALHARNQVLHSLWPFSERQDLHGHRNLPRTTRSESDELVKCSDLSAAELPSLVAELLDLYEECCELELHAQMGRFT